MADQRGFLAPAASVPLFMEAALKYPEHREALLRLAGRRGQYLAEQNPDWAQLRRIGSRRDELWLSPDPDDRTAWFDYIRTVDPELASEELEIAWDDEATASRLHFLDHLDVGWVNTTTRSSSLHSTIQPCGSVSVQFNYYGNSPDLRLPLEWSLGLGPGCGSRRSPCGRALPSDCPARSTTSHFVTASKTSTTRTRASGAGGYGKS